MLIKITIFGLSKFWFLICEVLLSNSIVKSCTYIYTTKYYVPWVGNQSHWGFKGKKAGAKTFASASATTLVLMLNPRRIFRDTNGLLLWLRRSLFWLRCCFVATFSVIGELAGETPLCVQ